MCRDIGSQWVLTTGECVLKKKLSSGCGVDTESRLSLFLGQKVQKDSEKLASAARQVPARRPHRWRRYTAARGFSAMSDVLRIAGNVSATPALMRNHRPALSVSGIANCDVRLEVYLLHRVSALKVREIASSSVEPPET